MTVTSISTAKLAIREFDSANANGQPIYLTLLEPTPGPDRSGSRRNPFDTARQPAKSLFERVSAAPARDDDAYNDELTEDIHDRSHERNGRRSDTSGPPPKGIDRYVPGRSAPGESRRDGRASARRDATNGDGRLSERGGGARRENSGAKQSRPRPRKTQEELDREMEDYWGSGAADDAAAAPALGPVEDEGGDVDMIE